MEVRDSKGRFPPTPSQLFSINEGYICLYLPDTGGSPVSGVTGGPGTTSGGVTGSTSHGNQPADGTVQEVPHH